MSVSLSRAAAFAALELPVGADIDSIRTSYKRLAQKWHPDKHPGNMDAFKTFQRVSQAYKRLDSSNDTITMSAEEMFEVYRNTLFPNAKQKQNMVYSNYLDEVIDTSDSDEFRSSDEDESDLLYMLGRRNHRTLNRRDCYDEEEDSDNDVEPLTAEQREQLANELITEEEQNKRKLEKRRAKKKLRREKKRLEKESLEKEKNFEEASKTKEKVKKESNKENKIKSHEKSAETPKLENEDFDPNAAFYAKVSKKQRVEAERAVTPKTTPPVVAAASFELLNNTRPGYLNSHQYAIEGNARANEGHYREAIMLFSKAISLDSSDFRFFGNRSFCFERTGDFDKALADALKAISLAPDWPKGYFRQGIALAGLKLYAKAEEAFKQLLRVDSKCEDARLELLRVRSYQIMEMGFTQEQAEFAASKYDSVQQALDALLSGLVIDTPSFDPPTPPPPTQSNGFSFTRSNGTSVEPKSRSSSNQHGATNGRQAASQSNPSLQTPSAGGGGLEGEEKRKGGGTTQRGRGAPLQPIPAHHYEEAQKQIQANRQQQSSDIKMNPHNPEGLTSLWVGNVLPVVTQEELSQLFAQFGKLQSVKCLPEKYCAFVNFYNKECAGTAMQKLQGRECGGQHLLIKFPDNPISAAGGHPGGAGEHSKHQQSGSSADSSEASAKQQRLLQQKHQLQQLAAAAADKLKGPVNGNECYFWRTTGCKYPTDCHYRHVPDHQGIDKKPWHKSK